MGFNEYIIVLYIYTFIQILKVFTCLRVQYSIQALMIQIFANMKFSFFSFKISCQNRCEVFVFLLPLVYKKPQDLPMNNFNFSVDLP